MPHSPWWRALPRIRAVWRHGLASSWHVHPCPRPTRTLVPVCTDVSPAPWRPRLLVQGRPLIMHVRVGMHAAIPVRLCHALVLTRVCILRIWSLHGGGGSNVIVGVLSVVHGLLRWRHLWRRARFARHAAVVPCPLCCVLVGIGRVAGMKSVRVRVVLRDWWVGRLHGLGRCGR